MPDTPSIPAWFRFAYDVAVNAALSKDEEYFISGYDDDESFFQSLATPFEAVEVLKNASRAFIQEADLLAEAMGISEKDGQVFGDRSPESAIALNSLAKAFEIYESSGGRAAVRNSARACLIRNQADEYLSMIDIDLCPLLDGCPKNIEYAVCGRAAIDRAGIARRGVEGIVNPAAAGLGVSADALGSLVEEAQTRIAHAELLLGEAANFGFSSWNASEPGKPGLLQILQNSLAYEKNYLAQNLDPQKAYDAYLKNAQSQAASGDLTAAAQSYLQAGACGRLAGAPGETVLGHYEHGLELLKNLPEEQKNTRRAWAATVRDHASDLSARFPDQGDKIAGLEALWKPLLAAALIASMFLGTSPRASRGCASPSAAIALS